MHKLEVKAGKPSSAIVWGNKLSSPIVWGNKPYSPIVWGNKPSSPIVWGNKPSYLIVWGNKPSSSIVWGNKPSSPFVWGNKPSSPIVRGNKPSSPFVWGIVSLYLWWIKDIFNDHKPWLFKFVMLLFFLGVLLQLNLSVLWKIWWSSIYSHNHIVVSSTNAQNMFVKMSGIHNTPSVYVLIYFESDFEVILKWFWKSLLIFKWFEWFWSKSLRSGDLILILKITVLGWFWFWFWKSLK